MSRKPADVASKEKNEYIPSFIANKPFYLQDTDSPNDYLEHQRLQKAGPDNKKWYDRGARAGPAATKYRKGACENCGAITHKTKDCLSRPRAKGAKWTGRDIQADEVVQDFELGWDAKRDRWNGYDASEYGTVVKEYEELEELRKQAKVDGSNTPKGDDEDEDPEAEEAKYAEESDMGRQQPTSTRNLRIREDTAKYLLNLDLDSAKYDPKTRSMVDMGATADNAAALVAEDNFMRASGDAAVFEQAQKYAWEAQERGDKDKVHFQANPTAAETTRRKIQLEADVRKEQQKKLLREKYGIQDQHKRPAYLGKPGEIQENERYVEYDESGGIKGQPKPVQKSRYKEDVLINNHTSIWGSWWKDFQWGYKCCHSTIRNSYCVGEEGRKAMEEAEKMRTGGDLARDSNEAKRIEWEGENEHMMNDSKAQDDTSTGVDVGSEAPRKRTLAEMQGGITEEELDAYKRSRAVAADPMASFLGKDELVQ
ncbi:mRNA splicing protein [Agyrium rufum]|nr:mRNA splicing protein [Agyrium rufum]